MFLCQSERPSFALIQYNWQTYNFSVIDNLSDKINAVLSNF
jgi:hypothetical protein